VVKIRSYVLVQITEAGALLLTDEQRLLIRAAMETLQIPWNGVQPAELFQARLSLDGNSAIYEITYDSTVLTDQAFAQVAGVLGIDAATLQAVISYEIFGDDEASSGDAARAYLAANAVAWESEA